MSNDKVDRVFYSVERDRSVGLVVAAAAVASGGGVGCTLRYLLGVLLSVQKTGYPYSTFLANLIGCLALGIFVSIIEKSMSCQYLFFVVGLCVIALIIMKRKFYL